MTKEVKENKHTQSRKVSIAKPRRFPVFYREVQIKQREEEKKMAKLIELAKKRESKNISSLPISHKSNVWTKSL